MGFWYLFGGMVKLELTSASFYETVQAINEAGIPLVRLKQRDLLTGTFWVHRQNTELTVKLCQKLGGKVNCLNKTGGFWVWSSLWKRPILLLLLTFILFFSLLLPSRVWFVEVEGNEEIPDRKILAAAEECGIRFGALRREVRSEKMKNALLAAIPQLQWAGVNTSGCVATICVRERERDTKQPEQKEIYSIVAQRDGYILSASATKGNLLVQPGQTVVSGQLLISGYTDCGIALRAECAEGEIFAQTNREMKVIMPEEHLLTRTATGVKKKISLVLGKKRIFLWKDSGISPVSCGRMYEEYYVTLPGNFRLPIRLCMEQFTDYTQSGCKVPGVEESAFLKEDAHTYLVSHMTAGEIVHSRESIYEESGCLVLEGTYICREMIGRMRLAQIGEIHG